MEHIMQGREVSTDLQAYQHLTVQILLKIQQQSQSQLSETVKKMRILRDILVSENPQRLMAARQAVFDVQRSSYSSRCTWEQIALGGVLHNFTAGTKRGLWETDTFPQHFNDYCGSSITVGPSKRCKHTGHLVRMTDRQRQGESGDGGGNPIRKDVNREECRNLASSFSNCSKDKSQYICKDIIEEVIPISSVDSVPGNDDNKSLECRPLSKILDVLCNLPVLRTWLSKKKRTERRRVEAPKDQLIAAKGSWDSLPNDLQENVLYRLGFEDLFRFKTVSKSSKEFIESESFGKSPGATSSPEISFTAINYYIKDKAWRCNGFDLQSKTWRTLPPFSPTLAAPDAELFKEYFVCGHGGLMCADVSKLPQKGKLVVFNPLTRKTFALPPLLNPRSPVLVHLFVDSETKFFKVLVAGSSTAIDEHLSKKMEVFDSETSKWENAPDLPGPAFGLNEHQAGVCLDGVLYFISFLEGNCHRGVVAFDVENTKWLDHKTCPIPFSMYSNTLQLVETNGKVYLFSEQERGGIVEHCIDMLEIPNAGTSKKCEWKNVVQVKKCGGRTLQVYPEHTCVSFGDGKLCVFNTLNHDGVVYDLQDGKQVELLEPPPPNQKGDNFFSLNPASFTLQLSFDNDPIPLIVDPN